jgi:hypothetical protein
MKFMIMEFGDEPELHSRTPEQIEQIVAFMVELDDELAQSGELVYSEVLEDGRDAHLVDRHGRLHQGSFTGHPSPLQRFWVVKVADEGRAIEIARRIAEVVISAVEVREVRVRVPLRP